jgi:hypothetical protein
MKTSRKLAFTALISATAILSGCKQEGCTNPDAVNYSSEADTDDGSCTYEGEVVFWHGAAASQMVIDYYGKSLEFYVDDQLVGSTAAAVYWNGAPNCGQNGSITVTKDLGTVPTRASTYQVYDEDGYMWWSGIVNFNANTCTSFELTP